MATKKPEGAPRWTYVAAAIVSIVGAIWAIASQFIPKPESAAKPASAVVAPAPVVIQQNAEAASGTAINATGAAKVSVGGEIPPSSASSAASQPAVVASQSARAGSSGTAVNATDSAEVVVQKP
jgi:hypothetical protein